MDVISTDPLPMLSPVPKLVPTPLSVSLMAAPELRQRDMNIRRPSDSQLIKHPALLD